MKRFEVCLLLSFIAGSAFGDTVSQSVTLKGKSGEVQSTVVVNSQCPAGRLLITNDGLRPRKPGTVVGIDLDDPKATPVDATFEKETDPDLADELFGTNDHDIFPLPDSDDVLLLWGVHLKTPLTPKPAWFDSAYKGSFGPGARRGTIVFRSHDCGKTFTYLTKIDPAKVDPVAGNTICAYPELPIPGAEPHLAAGGSDGQLARVLTDHKVYLAMGCMGQKPGPPAANGAYTSSSDPVGRTYLLRSTDGSSWATLGHIDGGALWRPDLLARPNGDVAVSVGNAFVYGNVAHPASAKEPPGWGDKWTVQTRQLSSVMGSPITGPVGASLAFLAYPAMIPQSLTTSAFGYRLFRYDPASAEFAELDPIVSTAPPPSVSVVKSGPLPIAVRNAVMHVTAIAAAGGPTLLYWNDVDNATATVRMRGRFLFPDGTDSEDFALASDASFPIASPAWYGHYRTAGGYATKPKFEGTPTTIEYHYYPIWVPGDGTVRYTHLVAAATPVKPPLKKPGTLAKGKPGPGPVELKTFLAGQRLQREEE